LYNAYVAALVCVDADVNSVLEVGQQQLASYAHFSQTMAIFALLGDNVPFVRNRITPQQVRTHQLSYINAILIQSRGMLVPDGCTDCQERGMTLFPECRRTPGHFGECCGNCKWRDHAAHCSVRNNDVLIAISDDEDNDGADGGGRVARPRRIAPAPPPDRSKLKLVTI